MNRHERNRRTLNTDHLNRDIGRRAARGGIIAIAAQPIRMFIQFFITAVLARLLEPDAFGLVAMAAAVTGFVALFSELGLTSATVQRDQIDQDMVSGLFFIGLGVSIVLVPIVCAFAPIAAWFFNDPRVSGLIFLMSLSFPLAALGSQHTALLLRSMRWMALQWTGLVGHAVGGLAGILVAWKTDLGYWSLAVTTLVAQIVTLFLIWTVCPWRPSLVVDWRGARSSLHFGAYLAGFSLVNFFHRQLDNIIVGWRFGAAELGFYSRGYQLMLLPLNLFNGPLSAAIEPSLSRLQNEPDRWRQAFLDALGLLMFLGAGTAACLIAVSDPLIAIIYGSGWEKAAIIFRWLAVSLFAGIPMNASGWIYISLGKSRRMFAWSLIFVPIVGLGFLLAIPYGAVGIAASYAITMNLLLLPCFAFACRGSPVGFVDTIKVVLPLAACGVVAALAGISVSDRGHHILVQLLLGVSVSGGVFLMLAGGVIMRANIYRELRRRVVTLSRGLAGEVRLRAMPYLARLRIQKK
jgi:polysaccharide transporter, PST family